MPLPENDRVLHRVGLIGDIHGEDEALDLVLRYFLSIDADTILSVGDVVDGPGDVNRCCALLRENNVFTVSGNHERWVLADFMRGLPGATGKDALQIDHWDWLQQLPKTIPFQTRTGMLLLCHGLGENDMAMVKADHEGYALEANLDLQALIKTRRYQFVVSGHSHESMVRNIGGITFINVGTLDRHDRQVCGVIDFDQRRVDFFDIRGKEIIEAEQYYLEKLS